MALRTPKNPQDNSPSGENSEDESLIPQFNEATMSRPIFNEDEWLAMHSIIEDTIFNPATMSIAQFDEDD
jgi:hypothetical protein